MFAVSYTLAAWSRASYTLAAWSPALVFALAAVVVAHLGGGAQWTMSTYGLQLRVEPRILGRVMAGDFAIVTLVVSLTSFAAGVVSSVVGVRWAITIFAGAAALSGAVYLRSTRGLALVDREQIARLLRQNKRMSGYITARTSARV